MDTVSWDKSLIVDSDQLRNSLSFWFNRPVNLKQDVNGLSDSDWVYGEIPIKQTGKVFRFAVYLFTGKAVVLFIQSGYLWLTGEWEDLLIQGIGCKLGRDGEEIPIDFRWSRKTDFNRGETLTCIGWFRDEDFRNYKQAFVQGLDYSGLWSES